jgi:microcystin-dependent protein
MNMLQVFLPAAFLFNYIGETIMRRFQRPINEYTGSDELLYRDKYQQDSNSVPKIAISSAKVDGDFNYLVDAVNTLDEDIKSVVHSGISNQTIEEKHLANNSVTELKLANEVISSRTLQPGSITNAKIADLAITTPKLANNSVTKDKMATSSIGTDELEDKSITRDKLADDAISDSVPVGTIAQFTVDLLPTGWILCNGATISKNTYPKLVRFLTGSDVILSAQLPNLNTDEQAATKLAIKAFSDTVELANLDVAGLTQDIADNSAQINNLKQLNEETVLWEGNGAVGLYTLSESVKNFNEIIIQFKQSNSADHFPPVSIKTSQIENNRSYYCQERDIFGYFRFEGELSIKVTVAHYFNIVKVVGVK